MTVYRSVVNGLHATLEWALPTPQQRRAALEDAATPDRLRLAAQS